MPGAFAITIIFIVATTLVGAFVKGRSKDRCLVDFAEFPVTLELAGGKRIWGNLAVEPTGMELMYGSDYLDEKDGHIERSYIIYKSEFANIEAVIRYHDVLDDKMKKERERKLRRYYHPNFLYPLFRRLRNVYYTIRDAVMEVVTLVIGRIRSATPAGAVLSGQEKYVSKIQQDVLGTAYSYEPLLEKYIGKKVVFKMKRGEALEEYCGIMKDYTPDFMEMVDVDYKSPGEQKSRKADLIMSRQLGAVRHLGK